MPPSQIGSAISDTDVRLFKSVANPEHFDIHAQVEATPSSSAPRMAAPKSQDSLDNKFVNSAQQPRLPVIAETNSTEYDSDSSEGEVIRPSVVVSNKSKADYESDSSDSYSYSDSEAESDKKSEIKYAKSEIPSAPPSVQPGMSKQDMLYELDRMVEIHNVKLSRNFTISDDIMDIQRELDMHRVAVSDSSMLIIMREGLMATTAGIEMANSRFGLLSLDGWSAEVASDSRRYDPTLLRLKQKYMRSAVLQPEAELAFLLGSSAISYHIKSRNKKVEAAARREKRKSKQVDVEIDSEDEELPSTFTETPAK